MYTSRAGNDSEVAERVGQEPQTRDVTILHTRLGDSWRNDGTRFTDFIPAGGL